MSNIRLADPSRTVEPTHRRRYQLGDGLAGLMGFEAATLAAAAFLHLHGNIQGRSRSFDPDMAGIAEAVIGVVLVVGAVAAWRAPDRGRRLAIGAVGFAIVGFVVGLSFTARGGRLGDVLYHVIMLPILVLTLVLLVRVPREESSFSRQRKYSANDVST
jgi:MFS family permease